MVKRESAGIRRESSRLSFFDPIHGSSGPKYSVRSKTSAGKSVSLNINIGEKNKKPGDHSDKETEDARQKTKTGERRQKKTRRCFCSFRLIKTKELDLTTTTTTTTTTAAAVLTRKKRTLTKESVAAAAAVADVNERKVEIFKITKQISI